MASGGEAEGKQSQGAGATHLNLRPDVRVDSTLGTQPLRWNTLRVANGFNRWFKLGKRRLMDKLRALQYFAAAAAEKSLSGAARGFGVSVTAVAKQINALEKILGANCSTARRVA